jgi:hypothetical protein
MIIINNFKLIIKTEKSQKLYTNRLIRIVIGPEYQISLQHFIRIYQKSKWKIYIKLIIKIVLSFIFLSS